jgi:hypothetical protein
MRLAKGFVAMVIAVASVVAVGPAMAAQSDDKKPAARTEMSAEWKAYVEYVNALARATKLEDLYQHMATAQVEFFKGFSKSDGPKVLQSLKDTMTRTGAFSGTMHLVREDVEPTAKYLVLEATTPDNKKVQGRVKMVKETGWVKLASVPDDEDWHEVKGK